jgi:hypothetical protein
MILRDYRERLRLEQARTNRSLWMTRFSVPRLLDEVRNRLFPELSKQFTFDIAFVTRGPLACITHSPCHATIYMHEVLNHPGTPLHVIEHIVIHELTHLRVPPRTIGSRLVMHPPEFWEEETRLSPKRVLAWEWIWMDLCLCIKRRPRLERIDVLPSWKARWGCPLRSLADAAVWVRPRSADPGFL